jgi:thiol:disulfide interchange protein DsbA
MASGKPAKIFEEGRKWGERIKVQSTPTVLIDGNIKAESIDPEGNIKSEINPENLKLIIQSILDADGKK